MDVASGAHEAIAGVVANSSSAPDAEANNTATDTMAGPVDGAGLVAGEVGASVGRITTSLLGTGTPLLTSRRTGHCWRRLISTVWAS